MKSWKSLIPELSKIEQEWFNKNKISSEEELEIWKNNDFNKESFQKYITRDCYGQSGVQEF